MTFPRREKVVRRRTRKDPGQISRRAGLPAFVHILLLAVIPFSSQPLRAAAAQGPVSKSIRVEPARSEASPVHFNLNFLPWRKESAARQSVQSIVSTTKKTVRPESVPEPTPGAKGASYLPAGGALPLRFASARKWPERMSTADERALSLALAPDPDLAILPESALAQTSAGDGTAFGATGPATAGLTGGGAVTIVAASADAAPPTRIVSRPAYVLSGEAILTADLVLNSLGNLSHGRNAVPAHFRPAVPEDRSLDSVPMAVAP